MNKRAYKTWGTDIDPEAKAQMDAAISLPITVAGALMPDAHVGYGLPIGGVLATEDAVIPYGVGVDIACRMMMTIFDVPTSALQADHDVLKSAIEKNTRFGVGAEWKDRKHHQVMDEDWDVSPITREYKDKAHRQLGTSGSGSRRHPDALGPVHAGQDPGRPEIGLIRINRHRAGVGGARPGFFPAAGA